MFQFILGGEEPIFYSDDVPPLRDEEDRGGLANYFTSGLEASFISRRGRPPVIRAAEKVGSFYLKFIYSLIHFVSLYRYWSYLREIAHFQT